MIEIKQCPACRGARKILGMGMIFHDCKTCKGIGHIKNEEPKEQEAPIIAEGESAIIGEIKKKKGRPFNKKIGE